MYQVSTILLLFRGFLVCGEHSRCVRQHFRRATVLYQSLQIATSFFGTSSCLPILWTKVVVASIWIVSDLKLNLLVSHGFHILGGATSWKM
jgi:hypothetical protein